MYLSCFKPTNLRNLASTQVELSPTLNVFEGNNAAGKSSLLEGVGFLLTGRSFRTSKHSQLIEKTANSTTLFGLLSNDIKIGINISRGKVGKKARINDENVRSLSKLAELYPVQLLTPESYHLIDSGPNQRRKFFDWLLFHVEHEYKKNWGQFNRIINQRNSYLRSLNGNVDLVDQISIDVWDTKLDELSRLIDNSRLKVLERFNKILPKVLLDMSLDFAKDLSIHYKVGYSGNSLYSKLKDSINKDVINRSTSSGAHRSDVQIRVGRVDVKEVLSRGQKKMLINALFLVQTELLKELSKSSSLFIIDDFSSELDEGNQLHLIKSLHQQKDLQVIISCLESRVLKPVIKEYNNVSMFHVEHGEISKVTL